MPFLVYSSLLLAVLSTTVIWLMPIRTPEQQKYWVPMRQGMRNFLMAKKMAAGLIDTPTFRWSGPIKCGEVGRGVWYAEGVVGVESSFGGELLTPWKALFIPATAESLYLEVGSREKGDFALAIRQAGIQPPKP